MSKKRVIVVGGGELGRVVIEAAIAAGFDVIGFVDNLLCEETTARVGARRLGTDSDLQSYPDAYLILGIGSLSVSMARQRVVEALDAPRERWATVVHPYSYVSPAARLSEGVIVLAGAVINSGACVHRHSIINLGAMIDHDVVVGEFVHVAPQSALGGGSSIGNHSYVGMGAIVRDHLHVGNQTMIGMGAVVTQTFSPGATLIGVPAKPLLPNRK